MRTSRVIALALVVGTFMVSQEVFIDLASGKAAHIGPRAIVALCFWLAWVPLAPLLRIALRRWPTDARPLYRPLLAHAAVALSLGAVQARLAFVLQSVVHWPETGGRFLTALTQPERPVPFVWTLFTSLMFYAVVVIVYTALRFRTLYAAAKLDTLRSQLRPHFLFTP